MDFPAAGVKTARSHTTGNICGVVSRCYSKSNVPSAARLHYDEALLILLVFIIFITSRKTNADKYVCEVYFTFTVTFMAANQILLPVESGSDSLRLPITYIGSLYI